MAHGVRLSYPDFAKYFHLHTDASDIQLGGVIVEEGKSIFLFAQAYASTEDLYGYGKRVTVHCWNYIVVSHYPSRVPLDIPVGS